MKRALAIAIASLCLLGQEQAPAPVPDQAAVIAELQATNQRAKAMGNPARSWLADEWTLVCFDEQMKWAMQAKMMGAATRKTYLKHGIKRLIIWNGKKAWSKDLVADGPMEAYEGKVPGPAEAMSREDLAQALQILQ